MGIFSSAPRSYMGIDIGSVSIKIVELTKEKGRPKLVTYGFSEYSNTENKTLQNDINFIAKTINKVCAEADVQTRNAISALPTFSVFSSIINLTNVNPKDISSTIYWEAKKVVPLPLEEMMLSWKIINENEKEKSGENVKVLLTGAPRALVKKYIGIFKEARINLLSLETEAFSLIRSLLGNDKSAVMIVEMGATTTDVTVVEKGIPLLNRSVDMGGFNITKAISDHLRIGLERAEQFKYDLGLSLKNSQDDIVPRIIIESLAPIINEIKYAITLYQTKNNKNLEKIILSGGSSFLPNLPNYLSGLLNMTVIIGDPWASIIYPEDLKPVLDEIGPAMAVAVGLALREID